MNTEVEKFTSFISKMGQKIIDGNQESMILTRELDMHVWGGSNGIRCTNNDPSCSGSINDVKCENRNGHCGDTMNGRKCTNTSILVQK